MNKTENIKKLLLLATLFAGLLSGNPAQAFPASPHERIYLHLDRYLYFTGGHIWYKAYITDRFSQDVMTDSKVLYLELIGSNQTMVAQQILRLENGQAYGDIFLSDTLASGYYTLYAYTNPMKYHDPTSLYRKQLLVYNRFGDYPGDTESDMSYAVIPEPVTGYPAVEKAQVNILCNKNNYGIREKVELELHISYEGKPVTSSFSVSVVKVSPVEPPGQENITHELLPENTFQPGEEQHDMSGNGKNYNQEVDGILVSGTLVCKQNGNPVAGKRLLISIPDSVPAFDYCLTDPEGHFSFILNNDFASSTMYLLPEDKNLSPDSLLINWEKKFLDNLQLSGQRFVLPDLEGDYLLSQRKRIAIGHAYGIDRVVPADKISQKTQYERFPFYGIPSDVVYPEKFQPLPNFREIAREILPWVRFTGRPGNYSLDIFNPATSTFMPQSFVLIDGVPVYDLDQLARLGSTSVKRIEIQATYRVYGDLILNGMLAVYTWNNKIHSPDLSKSHLVYQFPKFSKPGRPVQPVYRTEEQKRDRIPDFRDLLCWEPENSTGPDGFARLEFYTSDEMGLFRITVEGISVEGIPFSSTCDINVIRVDSYDNDEANK